MSSSPFNIWLLIGLLTGSFTFAEDAGPEVESPERPGWVLVFQDEFDGPKIDSTKWNVMQKDLDKNKELQFYTRDNVYLEDGCLVLRSRQRRFGRREYTSGHVDTLGRFALHFGRVEIRAQLPGGQGLWPAHWLLPSNRKTWPPEIDIMEMLGHKPRTVYMTNHFGVWPDNQKMGDSYKGPDFTRDFHTFALEWEPGQLRWFVDGVQRYATQRHVPDEPFYLILNTAIGGKWPGNPDDSTVFPQYHHIDYVRVYAPDLRRHHYLITSAEQGRVKVAPEQVRYEDGTEVLLEAVPAIGLSFSQWTGDAGGSQNPLRVVMNQSRRISARFKLDARPPRLISKNAGVTTSSDYRAWFRGNHVVDGKPHTRWASDHSSPQWIQIDLGKPEKISALRLIWDEDYATVYQLQASMNGRIWTPLVTEYEGQGGEAVFTGLTEIARYVRMVAEKGRTSWGYSLQSFEVYR